MHLSIILFVYKRSHVYSSSITDAPTDRNNELYFGNQVFHCISMSAPYSTTSSKQSQRCDSQIPTTFIFIKNSGDRPYKRQVDVSYSNDEGHLKSQQHQPWLDSECDSLLHTEFGCPSLLGLLVCEGSLASIFFVFVRFA